MGSLKRGAGANGCASAQRCIVIEEAGEWLPFLRLVPWAEADIVLKQMPASAECWSAKDKPISGPTENDAGLSDAGLSDAGLSDAGLSDAGLSEGATARQAAQPSAAQPSDQPTQHLSLLRSNLPVQMVGQGRGVTSAQRADVLPWLMKCRDQDPEGFLFLLAPAQLSPWFPMWWEAGANWIGSAKNDVETLLRLVTRGEQNRSQAESDFDGQWYRPLLPRVSWFEDTH